MNFILNASALSVGDTVVAAGGEWGSHRRCLCGVWPQLLDPVKICRDEKCLDKTTANAGAHWSVEVVGRRISLM